MGDTSYPTYFEPGYDEQEVLDALDAHEDNEQAGKWQMVVDMAATVEAARELGVWGAILIEWHDWPDWADSGCGYYRREPGHHLIVLNRNQTPREASCTIYHELTHALQCEIGFNSDGEAYHAAARTSAEEALDTGIISWYEAIAQMAELIDYDLRLVRMEKVRTK